MTNEPSKEKTHKKISKEALRRRLERAEEKTRGKDIENVEGPKKSSKS